MTNPMTTKICQSCAMPLTDEKMFGTNQDGSKNEDYCIYCYKDGNFVGNSTMEQMIDFCAPICVKEGVYPDMEAAKAEMMKYFPKLKRWAK